MANIAANSSTKVYELGKWLGLNESPDGDTGLKMGEAAVMRNFRITRENHLQTRPGYAPVCTFVEGNPVRGLWNGYVNGVFTVLAACGGSVFHVNQDTWECTELGEIDDAPTFFFGFANNVYILTGSEYYVWDGESLSVVEGYVPIVSTACPPAGGGTLLERVNYLTGKRRVQYSPDGEATVFQLPETNVDEVLSVDGTTATWTLDTEAGTLTFSAAPEKGVNTVEVLYRKGNGSRANVTNMRFAEFYNGDSDTRVFLYGDGTNTCIYSDLDEEGVPSAEYFPDLNQMAVGSANTPITSMIRHYGRLLAFKTDSAYTTDYSTVTTDTGTVTAAFYCTPVNREIGCAGYGQALLVKNNPRTLHGRAVYEWGLAGNGTRDERNAKRISQRVEDTLTAFPLEDCLTFDDERRQEYYVAYGSEMAVHNYDNDTWYYYDHVPARCMVSILGEVYFGTPSGVLMHFSRNYRNDDLEPIDAYWESGSMDFDADWKRKYSSTIWVSIKPEGQGRVTVTAQSNKKSDYVEKEVSAGLSSFVNTSFAHWSFGTNRKPQVQRVRIKVKRFTFYKLIFKSNSTSAAATILATDFQIRYTGNVR